MERVDCEWCGTFVSGALQHTDGSTDRPMGMMEITGVIQNIGSTPDSAHYSEQMNPDGVHGTSEDDKKTVWETPTTELSC